MEILCVHNRVHSRPPSAEETGAAAMPNLALKPARMLTFVPHHGKPSPSARWAHHNLPIPQG